MWSLSRAWLYVKSRDHMLSFSRVQPYVKFKSRIA